MQKPAEQEKEAEQRAACCAKLIREDVEIKPVWIQALERYTDEKEAVRAFEVMAGVVAGIHFILPLKNAKASYEKRRKFSRSVEKFRVAAEKYQREFGELLPSPSVAIYRGGGSYDDVTDSFLRKLPRLDIEGYLEVLEDHLREPKNESERKQGFVGAGLWVHSMAATPEGQWPRNTSSAAIIWIIRALDCAGIPRNCQTEERAFISIAAHLCGILQMSKPPGDVLVDRKDIQNNSEFTSGGAMRWRR